jgi:hypothetical protein
VSPGALPHTWAPRATRELFATAFMIELTFTCPIAGNPYKFTTDVRVASHLPLCRGRTSCLQTKPRKWARCR